MVTYELSTRSAYDVKASIMTNTSYVPNTVGLLGRILQRSNTRGRLNAPMWCELFLANADNLSHEIAMLIDNLQAYKDAIDAGDAHSLQALLAEGNRLKREAEAQ